MTGLRSIAGPARSDAGGPRPLPVGTCLPDQNGYSTYMRLMAPVWFKVLLETLIITEFVLPSAFSYHLKKRKMEEAVKTVPDIRTCMHSEEYKTGT